MNFAGPFDAELTHDSPVSLGGERFTFDSKPGFTQHHASDSHVIVPDAHLLFSGDYTRIGSDLIISGDDHKFVVGNYFKGETRPALVSKDGATLSGHIVDALTGHVHYAQASGAPAAGQVIGNVLKLSGSATAIRNGVSIELHIGDAVQKGDVVQTASDSSIGMTFVDGSAFGMNSNARMVLNEMIYDPNGSSNSSLISLVQGTITFVAGQTAKNGNMRVETPVATMGIRGTAVLVEIGANDGPTKFSVLVEPDGHTGSYNLYDKTTGDLIGTVSQAGQVTFVSVNGIGQPPTALEQLKTLADQQAEKALIQQVFQLFFPNYNPDNSNPKSQKTGFGSPGDNINPFLFNNTTPDNQPIKIIVIPGVGIDPHTGQPNPPRIFFNTKAQFSADTVTAEQSITSSVKTFKISDVVHIDDPDINNGPFFDKATPFVAGSAVIKSAVSTNPNLSASFLSQFLHIDQQTGEVTFDRLGFNFLGQGETATFMLQVLSQSGPDSALVIIPIIISGDNDVPNDNGVPNGAPTIVLPLSDVVGGVKEDTPVGASSLAKDGTITFRDVDLSDTHTVVHEFTSSSSGSILNPASNPSLPGFGPGAHLGTFTLGPIVENATDTINTGTVQWHFSLPDNDPTLQSLADGQTITQVYTITITDVHGALVTQTVTITITGTNDAPVLTADASVHQAVEASNTTGAPDSVVDVATGTLVFTDLDLSDTHTASAALHPGATSVVWSGGNYNDIPQATRDALNGATTAAITENSTDTNNQGSVGWEFKLPDHLFDFLAHGETLTLIYDVTVTDNNGVSSTQQITVQIGAANDQPVITVIDTSATVQEDVDPVGGILKDTGSVTFTDTDLTDTHTTQVAYTGAAHSANATVSSGLALALASALTVPTSALAAGNHSFDWDFTLDNNLVQYLAEGETVTATYIITVKDNSGGSNDTSVATTVSVTITGTNDAPVVSGVATDPSAVEDGALRPIDALANASDIDEGTILTVVGVPGTLPPGVSYNAGNHTFTLDPGVAAYQHLAAGATTVVTVNYGVSDGIATPTPASVSWTITGTNDAPVVSGTVSDALVVEDGPGSVLNALANASDVDDGATLTVVNVPGLDAPGTLPPGVTYNAVNHTFMLDPSDAAYQHLAAGATTVVTVNYGVSDGIVATPTSASVSWTITGTNDAPTVSAILTDTASEGGAPLIVDLLRNALDVDDGDTLSIANVLYTVGNGAASPTIPPGLLVGPNAHSLLIDTLNATFDHLSVGDSTIINVDYDVKDGLGLTVHQTETITINGTNDAPIITLNQSTFMDSEAITDGPPVALPLANFVTISDVDTNDVAVPCVPGTLALVSVEGTAPTGGSIADLFTPDNIHGTIIYERAAFDYLAVGQHATATFTFDASSGPDTVHQTFSVTIEGDNDAPLLSGNGVIVAEIGDGSPGLPFGATKVFDINLSDPDEAGLLTVSATAGDGTVSGLSNGTVAAINANLASGFTYTPNNTVPNANDMVTLTVTDGQGASDTLHFVFQQNGTGSAVLTGTTGKDLIFSTGGDDQMTGLAGQDHFVFSPSSGHDTIMDFTVGEDKIDFRALTGMGPTELADLLANATHPVTSDTLLHLNGTTDTVLVKNVATLNVNDFILHA